MKKLLVIEDESPVLINILEMLNFEGFETTGAGNGLLGIQLAREILPDLILCDIIMPEVDGFEVLRELRSDSTTATIPFIFLTARGTREDMRKGMVLGADDYITKPYSSTELLSAIRTRLERHDTLERQRLRTLFQRLVQLHETERHRIAVRLQEEIWQTLTGLKIILGMGEWLPEDMLKLRLDEAKMLVGQVIDHVDTLSVELRPALLDDLGLLPSILQHIKRFIDQTQIQVVFKHAGLERRFPSEVETTAFRIVQESLSNVARHAEIEQVTVQLWVDLDVLYIRIEDEGRGFDVEKVIDSGVTSGLMVMQERVLLIDGQLSVISAPGAGTQVIGRLPLGSSQGTLQPPPAPLHTGSTVPGPLVEAAARSAPVERSSVRNRSAPAIKIVIGESHDLIRKGLCSLFEKEPGFSVVGEASNAQQTESLVKSLRPDVLAVDLNVGWDIVEQVTQLFPQTHVLMLSAHTDEAYVLEMFRKGATGYIFKESDSADLVRAVRDVAIGQRYLSRSLSERALDFYMNMQHAEDATLNDYGVLTNREREILKLIAQGAKNVEIADQLSISPRTVETHRANVMRKLELHTQADLIRYALSHGIVGFNK